jgi:uncharacterized damage-inducible protein DinB
MPSHPAASTVRGYVLVGLAATPGAIAALLSGATEAELDLRPDPDRFTLREVVAHLADWDPIWLERAQRIVAEDDPSLPGYDEGQFAIDNDYAHSDAHEQMRRFISGREAFLHFLKSLQPDAWERTGRRDDGIGTLTLFQLAAQVLGHDGYHVRQVVEFRGLGKDFAA